MDTTRVAVHGHQGVANPPVVHEHPHITVSSGTRFVYFPIPTSTKLPRIISHLSGEVRGQEGAKVTQIDIWSGRTKLGEAIVPNGSHDFSVGISLLAFPGETGEMKINFYPP
jgi:hypothetical protein